MQQQSVLLHKIVYELLSYGADPNALDAYGNTSLDIARNVERRCLARTLSFSVDIAERTNNAYIIEVLNPRTTQNKQEVETVQSVQSQHSENNRISKKEMVFV